MGSLAASKIKNGHASGKPTESGTYDQPKAKPRLGSGKVEWRRAALNVFLIGSTALFALLLLADLEYLGQRNL